MGEAQQSKLPKTGTALIHKVDGDRHQAAQQNNALLQSTPVPQLNAEHTSLGSIPAALVSASENALPYTNMGDSQFTSEMAKGQLTGYIHQPHTITCLAAAFHTTRFSKNQHHVEFAEYPLKPNEEPISVSRNCIT